jgi:VWFA-related protein
MPTRVKRSIPALLLGLSILLAISPANAQVQASADKPAVIRARAEMVMLPAIVTDRAGAHIADLAHDDFTILEDGHEQAVSFFTHVVSRPDVVQLRPVSANQVSNIYEGSSDRLTIIVLDLMNTSFLEQNDARQQLLKFLSESVNTTEPICLLTIEGGAVTVIHDFTTDPAVLTEALKQVRAHRSPQESLQADQAAFSDAVASQPTFSKNANARLAMSIMKLNMMGMGAETQQREAVLGTEETLNSLRQIGESFAGLPGRKSLIWATGGIPFDIDDVAKFRMRSPALLPLYENAWQALNRAQIAVYPLDLEELLSPGFVGPQNRQPFYRVAPAGSRVSNLELFAEKTGGKMCYANSNMAKCFREASTDSTDYYLLGFYRNSSDTKPGWRKLTVRVRRPNSQVRARSGYLVRGPQDERASRKEDLQLGLTSPLEYTDLPLTVQWTESSSVAGKKKIGFLFMLPATAAMIDETDKNHISLDFAALAKSANGAPVGDFSQTLEGRLDSDTASKLKSQGATFPGTMELASGDYTLRFVVRDNLSGRMGTASAQLAVP